MKEICNFNTSDGFLNFNAMSFLKHLLVFIVFKVLPYYTIFWRVQCSTFIFVSPSGIDYYVLCKVWVKVVFFLINIQVTQHHLLKRLFISPLDCTATFVLNQIFVLSSVFFSIVLFVYSCAIATLLQLLWFFYLILRSSIERLSPACWGQDRFNLASTR